MDKRYFNLRVGIIEIFLILIPLFAQSAAITSTTTGGLWSATSTWVGGVVPVANDAVTIRGGATVTVDVNTATLASISVNPNDNNLTGTLAFNSGSILNTANVTIGGNGNRVGAVTMTSGGTFKISGAVTLGSAGNFTLTPGTGTVEFNGAAAQTIPVLSYNNLTTSNGGVKTVAGAVTAIGNILIGAGTTLSISSSGLTVGGNWTNSGTFTHNSGTVTFNKASGTQTLIAGTSPFSTISHNAAGTLQLVTNSLTAAGSFTNSSGTFDANGLSATVAGITTISGGSYLASTATQTFNGGMIISGGTFTGSSGNVSVSGLTLNSGTLTAPSGTFNVTGNWSKSGGTFTPGTNTVTFNGGAAQTIGGTAVTTFNNVVLNNSNGLTLLQDATINSTLTLSAGRFSVGAKILTLGSSANAVAGSFSASNMIVVSGGGEIRKAGTTATEATYMFPVGDVTGTIEYSPVTVTFSGGTYNGYTSVKLTDAKHPNDASAVNFISRYWTITTNSYSGFSATVAATYVDADINGTETNILMGKWNGSLPWQRFPASMNAATNTLTATGITSFSDFTGINAISPLVSISANPNDTVCQNTSLTLTANATGDPTLTYLWNPGGATTSSISPSTAVAGNTTYTVTVTDGNGQTNSSTITIVVNPLPGVGVTASINPICFGTSTTLNASGAVNYSWSPALGLSATTGSSVSASPASTATYTVTGTNANGCVNTAAVTITVNPLPAANAGAAAEICLGDSVSIGAAAVIGNTYSWTSNPSGFVSASANPRLAPTDTTTFILTETITSTGCHKSDSVLIKVDPLPIADAGPDKTLTCVVTEVNLAGSSPTPGVTFSWVPSNGGVIYSGANTATPLVQVPGTYHLTVTNPATGCKGTDSVTVFQNINSPDISVSADTTLTCTVTSIVLTGSSVTANTIFNWTTSDGNIVSGASTTNPTIDAAGSYLLTVTDTINGCMATRTVQVFLNNTAPDVNAGTDSLLTCAVTSVILHGSSATPAAQFSWSGGSIISGGSTSTPTVDAAATYTLTVTDPVNGCTAKDSAEVMLNNTLPNAVAGADTTLTCNVTSIVLNGSSSTLHTSYNWTTTAGNIVSGNSTLTPTINGGGTYYLTVTDSINGCSNTDSLLVLMDTIPPVANAGPDKTLTCTVTQVTLNGSSSTPRVSYSWTATGGGIIFSGANTATPLVQVPGNYILTVTDTISGCSGKDSATVFQNINSPNSNAGNDTTLTCAVTSITLNGTSTTPNTIFSWATLDGNIVSGGSTQNPVIDMEGTYVLTVTDTINGCVSSNNIDVFLNNTTPNADAGRDSTLTCAVTSLTLNGASATAGALFSWSTTGGNITGTTLTSATIDAPGTYTLTVTDPVNGCTAKDSAEIMLNNTLPNVSAGADTVINCNHTSIALNGSSTTLNTYFDWTTNDGNIASGASTANPMVDAGGTYNLFVTDGINGCMASDTVFVMTDLTPPNVNAGADDTLTCAVTQLALLGSSSTPGALYFWTAINGGVILSGDSTATPMVELTGTYILTVTNPVSGCFAKDSVQIFQDIVSPDVNAGSDTTLTCAVTSIVLNGSSATANTNFNWSTNDGNIMSGAATANPVINAIGTYSLTVTNTVNGCQSTDSLTVNLNNTVPDANAGADDTLTCIKNTVTLNSSSSTVGAMFLWTTANGNIVSGDSTTVLVADAVGTYVVTVTDPVNGCTAMDSAMVFLNNTLPNVNAGADSVINCNNLSIAVNGSSATLNVSYNWSTMDGNIVSGDTTVTPIVNAGGTYKLTVTDNVNGCSASDSTNVTMDVTPPDANAGNDTTLTCTVTQVNLNGSSTTPNATFAWVASNGGAIFSGANTANPVVQVPGTYILIVTNPVSGCTAKDSATVFQNVNSPVANAGNDTTLTCLVTSIVLNGSSATANTKYSWSTSDGNIVSDGTTLNPTVNAAGNYMLTVTDTVNGCMSSNTVEVFLNNTTPNVNAGNDTTLTCAVTSVILNGTSTTGGAMFSWSTTTGNISSGGLSGTPTVDLAGTYTLTVTDPVNGCTAMDSAMVMLNNTVPDVNAGADSVINCNNPSIALNGSSASNVSFSWATADGNISSGAASANAMVDAAGTYKLTVTDLVNGCSAADSATVTIDVTPPVANAGNDTTLTCAVTQVALNGSSTTVGAMFTWTASNGGAIFSGANTANPVVQVPGTYILTVTNPVSGCTAKDSATVFQNVNSPVANAGNDTTLTCLVTSIVLNGSSATANTKYSWSTSDGNIVSDGTTLNPTVNAAGNYMLTVTDTVNGCMSSNTVEVFLNNTTPNVNAGNDTTLTCVVTSLILNGSSTTGGAMFSWSTATGNISSGGLLATPTVDLAGTYTLTVTDPVNGCTAMDSAMVFLNNTVPDVNAGADSVINCNNSSIALNGSSASNVSFSWATADGNISSGAATANAVVDAAGTYKLTVTDLVNGCSAADSTNVTMDVTPPVANAGNDTTLTCAVTQVSLNGSSTTVGAMFTWTASNGGAIFSGGNTATPIVQVPGTYILTVTNPVTGCTAKDSATVFQNVNSPVANAGNDTTLTCTVTSIVLNGTSSIAGGLYNWTTSDGNIVSGDSTLNPTVNAAGTYMLTITNTVSGCQSSDVVVVTLNNTLPTVYAGNDTMIGCGISSVMLHAAASGNLNYSWTTGTGNIVSGAATSDAMVDAAGVYTITVTDQVSGCSAKDSVMVGLGIQPVVDLGNDTTIVTCQAGAIIGATIPGMTYSWSTGDTTATIWAGTSGTYYLTVTNTMGCTASDTIEITLVQGTIAVDLGRDTSFMNCHAPTLTLDAGNQGATYLWSTAESTQSILVSTSGMYYVNVTDNRGCSASDTINVNVINNNITVNLGRDTTVCSCITLNAGNAGASYLWCGGQEYPQINACSTGTYCVTVSNGTCMDSDTIHVTVVPPPVVNLGNDTTIVSGTLILNAGNPGATYLWSTGETTQTIEVALAGTYYVTVTNAAGCSVTDTINVNVEIGIQEPAGADISMSVYPNPSVDHKFTLSFHIKDTADVVITITDVLGNEVYSEALSGFTGTYKKDISLEHIANGIYFTHVLSGKQKSTAKIILE